MDNKNLGVLIAAGVAAVELLIIIGLVLRGRSLSRRLVAAVEAAEDAARAAALAAPGGIDPEVVISLLRAGHPTSLDAVNQIMQRQMARRE